MADVIKREKTRYLGIKKLTYASGIQVYELNITFKGKPKHYRYRIPEYSLQDVRDKQIELSDKIRRNKSAYDDSYMQG
jgi:hypothetical protein